MSLASTLFFGAGTLLFFFWIYGIVSFYFDLRYRFIPAARNYLRDTDGDDRPDPEEYI
ncbi:hypothetical protein HALLA_02850 (plasmid) [Halostagnicola larsenii XH-48]|uniref:Uncharacterized protein n=1 Tax=Halostagnicola larsenii XH-48 TaxID=797299 RepID=W0JWA8_9EURY|nr:hypothetical protein [Halostagnicola larsenii]AHG01338.1 hypothetical protein HALLA_02850 [Halostagnicola larsenii XH-48]